MTAFEIIGNIDLRKLATDELNVIINSLTAEKKKREKAEAESDWMRVRQAINDYLDKYDEIIVCDGNEQFYLNEGLIDTAEIGIIKCK